MGITSCSPWAATVSWPGRAGNLGNGCGFGCSQSFSLRRAGAIENSLLVGHHFWLSLFTQWLLVRSVPHHRTLWDSCVGRPCGSLSGMPPGRMACFCRGCCSDWAAVPSLSLDIYQKEFPSYQPPLATLHKFVDSLLGLRIWVTSEAELHLLCFFAWD